MGARICFAFVSPLQISQRVFDYPPVSQCPQVSPSSVYVASRKRRAYFSATSAKELVQTGQVVAVERGRGIVDVARITGVSSAGNTVDIVLLEEFVKEMYVESKRAPTYEPVENVRPVISEYVPSQQGWIVLNQDLQIAKNYFETRTAQQVKERSVVVTEAPRKELGEAALKRQYFRPSKTQAFWGAAASLPISAFCYSLYASARQTYAANPAGDDLLSGEIFRKLLLFASGAASVGALVVGGALFLFALSKVDE